MIKKILVPLDGSKNSGRGLAMAIEMAKSFNASITGLIVVTPPSANSEFSIVGTTNKGAVDAADKVMSDSEAEVTKHGLVFTPTVMYGDAANNILLTAHSEQNFDLLVIGSRGLSSVKEIFFGSVSKQVLRASKIPVLLVK